MTPTQARLISERKERLARFERAGLAQARKLVGSPAITPRQVYTQAAAPNLHPRREYEKPAKLPAYAPIARRIVQAVAHEFNVPITALIGDCRGYPLPLARFVAVGLFLRLTGMSFPAIGRQLGGRDHTTILHGKKQIEKLLVEEAFRNRFEQIKAGLVRRDA